MQGGLMAAFLLYNAHEFHLSKTFETIKVFSPSFVKRNKFFDKIALSTQKSVYSK